MKVVKCHFNCDDSCYFKMNVLVLLNASENTKLILVHENFIHNNLSFFTYNCQQHSVGKKKWNILTLTC